jgi:hypothetical protein
MEINPLTSKPRQYLMDYQVPKDYIVCCYCDELIKKTSFYGHKYTIRHVQNKKILDIYPRYLENK